jgi:hypothetical protein
VRGLAYYILLAGTCLILGGCSDGEFGEGTVRGLIESAPRQLDNEQVTLTQGQVDCGAHEDLWDVESAGVERWIAKLTQKGRNLHFADDIRIGDQPLPYTQVRGQFSLQLVTLSAIHDHDAKTKIVDAKVGVKIDHPCFTTPLMLMGVHRGEFTSDYPARFQLVNQGDWQLEQILH